MTLELERAMGRLRIGGWDFTPATGELRHGPEVRRLEPRAARVLELLCAADGEIVSHEQLIAAVWGGRSLSDNSVAVVIGQLRRALGDDAREGRLIETMPKRGYRLVRSAQGAEPRPPRRAALAAAALAAALLAALLAAGSTERAGAVPIAVSDVANATGERAYDPLARATSELIVAELSARGFAVRRIAAGPDDSRGGGGSGGGGLRLAAKLVMWNGEPYLGLTATDAAGTVRWSAMAPGSAARVPAAVDRELDRLKAAVEAR